MLWGGSQSNLLTNKQFKTGFKRDSYHIVNNYLEEFSQNPSNRNFWTIMGGLRGTGKTTILSQLFLEWFERVRQTGSRAFYLSLDEVYSLSVDFVDIQKAVEYKLGESIYFYKHPIYLFLDEVHFVDKWSVNAKILYDRCNQLFLLCTGSSAISFWTNADIARRAEIVNIHPLSLSELINMKIINSLNRQGRQPDELSELNCLSKNISDNLQQILLGSKDSKTTWKMIQPLNDSDRQI